MNDQQYNSSIHALDNEQVYRTIWSHFSFSGFDSATHQYIPFWKQWAITVLEKLYTGNTAIVAETGSGKTIIAHLVATGRFQKILFLVPERVLAKQHEQLLHAMIANEYSTQNMLGTTPYKKRIWNAATMFTFATPQTFIADFNRYRAHMDFDLVVFDEFHHATGHYDYVTIAALCAACHIRTLSLSASPGSSQERIARVSRALHIEHFVYIPHPNKNKMRYTNSLFVSLDDRLLHCESILQQVMQRVCIRLKQIFPHTQLFTHTALLRNATLDFLEQRAQHLLFRDKYDAMFLLATYRKLLYIRKTVLVDAYSIAIQYWDHLMVDTSKSSIYICTQPELLALMSTIQTYQDSMHPKIDRLITLVQHHTTYTRGVIFVDNKRVGIVIRDILRSIGKRVEVLYGKTSLLRQHTILKQLQDESLDYIIATSVIEEGVSIPEIDCVINFSMPLTEKSRIQRMGRTGRIYPGIVEYIILDHPFDTTLFFSTARGVRTMKQYITHESPVIQKRKIRCINKKMQLDMFFD